MVLSDRAIRRLIDAGRIVIDPFDAALMQPASLDVRVDRLFRVFRNSPKTFSNASLSSRCDPPLPSLGNDDVKSE